MVRLLAAVIFLGAIAAGPAVAARKTSPAAAEVTAAAIDSASPAGANDGDPALIAKAEILLDRAGFSPGEVDGADGDNYRKAVQAFQQAHNLAVTGKLDDETWTALTANVSAPALVTYTIDKDDVVGPFDERIPASLTALAKLKGLSFRNPTQELAEKFHMSGRLLRSLNRRAQLDRAGTQITVADVAPMGLRPGRNTIEAVPPRERPAKASEVATVVVDKPARDVRAYDRDGGLIAFYPATIGSSEKPAPSGSFKVRRVAWNPDYHYDPKFAWKGVKTKRKLTVAPGPNNPVGLVWIDLTAPSYGIHGTPEPANVGKTESHGCIRLTNWDALNLAAMVHPGTVVQFDDQDSPVVPFGNAATNTPPGESLNK